ncbi:RND transporter [Roseivirga spongicola]|jgi:NodT family efflux transporter outer membrane factor (OMF) lipoprotein|uniref:RND transporter n=1 Tax=Roseivirga spongicola TaxID=333140 RepID=A0A150XBF3_9BACT|nr:efflux transporter outer membrane subunit [Roseivirga spongicola]KYG76002.1 RND transporter [Roseivirga spongicola]
MSNKYINKCVGIACLTLVLSGCGVPALVEKTANSSVPESFVGSQDTTNTAQMKWKEFFTDPYLVSLIDTALNNNQEVNIMLQEIEISRNEVSAKTGEYLPSVSLGAGLGVDKVGRYTRNGAVEHNLEVDEGEEFPEPLGDYMVGAFANWEVDIWRKLRTSKKSALTRYLASVEGRNFMVTNLIAEIANSYYELLALDTQLDIVNQNIQIQSNALEIVKYQKQAAKVTELAVKRFEAEVFNTRSLQFDIKQRIVETENKINFLIGRFPQSVLRSTADFNELVPATIQAGVPAQLLQNRPDVRQAELELEAAKLDIQVARANFYPSLGITGGIGLNAISPKHLISFPESMIFGLAGDLMAPLVNKKAIKAEYQNANAKQIQAIYEYERTILNAYIEVANQLSNISNLQQSYDLKEQQVNALTESISISNNLFRSARADYMEVLLTQRDALESRFELVETKVRQMNAVVHVYQALGGGWN